MEKNKSTILVVTGGYFPGVNFGGIATSRYNFSEAMGNEYDIAIVTRNHDYKTTEPYKDIQPGWNIYGKARVLYLSDEDFCEREFARIIEETKPILVYASGTITTYFYFNKGLFRAAKAAGVPVLVTPDGDVCTNAMRTKKLKKFAAALVCRLENGHKNVHFQATTPDEVKNLPRYLGIRKEKITLLPNLPGMFPARRGYEKDQGSLKVVFAARIHPIKNLLFAIEAVNKLRCPVFFDIYGSLEDTVYWQKCQEAIANAPENVTITYKGRVDAEQAKKLAMDYDCFLLPTTSENYGYAIEEALLCGCPAIISRGTTPWDDVHGQAGFAGDLADQQAFVDELERIAAMDAQTYGEYTKNIANYIEQKLSYEKLRQDYKNLINTVAATGRK